MTLLEQLRHAKGGATFDELVVLTARSRESLAVELMHLVSDGKARREDGIYWAAPVNTLMGPTAAAPESPRDKEPPAARSVASGRKAPATNLQQGAVPVLKAQAERTSAGTALQGKPANDRPAAPIHTTEEPTMAKQKRCPTCKTTDPKDGWYGNGYCRPCGRAKDLEYRARRKTPATSTAAEARETPTAPPAQAEPQRIAARAAAPAVRRQVPAQDVEKLLLPAQGRIACALEQRECGQVVQLGSDPETVIEATSEQMDAICAWWARVRAKAA